MRWLTTVAFVTAAGLPAPLRVAERPGVRVIPVRLACCAVELDAAESAGLLIPEAPEHGPATATVVVVAGTVTGALAGAIEAAMEPGASVVAFGACASTGGPYWDAPSVVNGADTRIPVTEYVPGCPPRPTDLIRAVLEAVPA